jgi:hypothetical protein
VHFSYPGRPDVKALRDVSMELAPDTVERERRGERER